MTIVAIDQLQFVSIPRGALKVTLRSVSAVLANYPYDV